MVKAVTPHAEADAEAEAAARKRGRPLAADRSDVILDAVLDLLHDVGYDQLRMQDVADRAGVGGHRVAIPVDRFTWDAEKGAFKLPEDVASVKSMPEWVEGAQTATGSSQPPRNEPRIPPSGAGDSGSPAR